MPQHDQLTIVSVYGHNDGSSVIPSILHSMNQLPGSRGMLISLARPMRLPSSIEWRQCQPVDYLQYSVFMMHILQSYIETDYALVVQDDGWVLNGENFKEDYYNYDYVGAPSHCGKVGDRFYLKFTWNEFSERTVVQNGGFSLRSRKFMQAPNKHGIAHMFANEIHNWNEDAQMTALLRPTLENLGCKFAPEEVARDFAIEYVGPGFHDDFDLTRLVGHHAQIRKLIGDKHVRLTVTPEQMEEVYGERRVLDHLLDLDYRIEYATGQTYEKTTEA